VTLRAVVAERWQISIDRPTNSPPDVSQAGVKAVREIYIRCAADCAMSRVV
jgi:hypothetical protein